MKALSVTPFRSTIIILSICFRCNKSRHFYIFSLAQRNEQQRITSLSPSIVRQTTPRPTAIRDGEFIEPAHLQTELIVITQVSYVYGLCTADDNNTNPVRRTSTSFLAHTREPIEKSFSFELLYTYTSLLRCSLTYGLAPKCPAHFNRQNC